jgi:hypothetical protein
MVLWHFHRCYYRAARYDSFMGKGFSLLVVGYAWIRWTPRFVWFEPSERNTLRTRKNEVILLKPGLTRVSLSLFSWPIDPCEVASTRDFYSLRSDSYNESQGPISDLGAGKTVCCRAQRLGVANDVFNGVSSVESFCLIALLHWAWPVPWCRLVGRITSVAMSKSGQLANAAL